MNDNKLEKRLDDIAASVPRLDHEAIALLVKNAGGVVHRVDALEMQLRDIQATLTAHRTRRNEDAENFDDDLGAIRNGYLIAFHILLAYDVKFRTFFENRLSLIAEERGLFADDGPDDDLFDRTIGLMLGSVRELINQDLRSQAGVPRWFDGIVEGGRPSDDDA